MSLTSVLTQVKKKQMLLYDCNQGSKQTCEYYHNLQLQL